jgi:glycosyltransferase involved in cell wall biosynthesis
MSTRILFLLAGRDLPSTKLRVLEHLKRLESKTQWQWDLAYLPKSPLSRLGLIKRVQNYQGVFIQKKLLHSWEIVLLKALNPKLIFDFDDAIMYPTLDPSLDNKKSSFLKARNRYKNFYHMISRCQTVIAGNPFLQQEAKKFNNRVYLLPTPIDTERYHNKLYRRKLTENIFIGWYGSPGNLIYLGLLANVLKEISIYYPQVVLKIISQRSLELPGVKVMHTYWQEEKEVEEIGSFDIGLMPLGKDLWSRGKCGLKLLKYMALGIPVLATATEATRTMVTDGIEGFLLSEPQEWLEKLRILIENPRLREEMGRAARKKAELAFSYQVLSPSFQAILESVYLQ